TRSAPASSRRPRSRRAPRPPRPRRRGARGRRRPRAARAATSPRSASRPAGSRRGPRSAPAAAYAGPAARADGARRDVIDCARGMATEPPTAQQTAGAGGEARGFREAVRALGAELEGAALEAEAERALPRRIVGLLRGAGLFWLKTARELGGSELDPLDFCDVLEEVAYLDASAAWAVMVGNGATGVVSGLLDDDGAAEVFGSPAGLPILAGQFIPRGEAARVAGGYRISGRWSFCSGISHADWAVGGVPSPEDGQPLIFCVPVAEVEVHDVWHAAGLQGTASNDFSLADRFVPASRVVVGGARRRGGRLFRQPHRVFVGNEVPPVAVGVARRALDDMAATAAATARAWSA